MLEISIFTLIIILSLLLLELLKKSFCDINQEVLRKVPHILIGIIFCLIPFFMERNEIIIFSVILFLGVFLGKYSPFFNTIFYIDRKTYGIWLTPISLGLMAFLWIPQNTDAFVFGILVLTFSDSFAALSGKILGKKKILKSEKTFVGTTVFFVTTFFLTFLLSKNIEVSKFVFISLLLTFLEFFFIYGVDNLVLPIVASYLFYFLL